MPLVTSNTSSPAFTGNPTINGTSGLQSLVATSIDAVAATTGTLGTTQNNGLRFYPIYLYAICDSVTGFVTAPIISLGTNSATFNNILALTTLTGVSAVNLYLPVPIVLATSVAANTAITYKFGTNAVSTAMSVSLSLFGFYK